VVGGFVDDADTVALFFAERGVAAEDLGVAEDAVERGAEFVADAGEEAALGTAGGIGGVFGSLKDAGGFAALGDIDGDALEVVDGAGGVADGADGFETQNVEPSARTISGFEIGDGVAGADKLEELVAAAGVRVELAADVVGRGHHGGGVGVAAHAREGGIDAEEAAVDGGEVEAFEGVFENAAVVGFGAGAGGFGAVALDSGGGLLGDEAEELEFLGTVGGGVVVVLEGDDPDGAAADEERGAEALGGGTVGRGVGAAGGQNGGELGRGGEERAAGGEDVFGKTVLRGAGRGRRDN